MKRNMKYVVAVALLAVLVVVFGLAGTATPVSKSVSPQQELSSSSSSSVTHFMNPPTYDSRWVSIRDRHGQSFNLGHNLNTTEVLVDVMGKRSPNGGEHKLFFGTTSFIQGFSQTYGGADWGVAYSMVQTFDGGYALAGSTYSFGAEDYDFWLVKTDADFGFSIGLSMIDFTNSTITLYRGRADPYWNYVRVRIWLIKEPTWQFGDVNQDGVVDAQDLFILSQNYGKTFSILSLSGIVAVAGIHQYKKRKQPK